MSGHGSKLGRKMEAALVALVSTRNLEEASKLVGVSTRTLLRWQKLPEFDRALRESRLTAFRHSIAKLQQGSVPAATTLLKIMIDSSAPVAVRARCAFHVLVLTQKAIEIDEVEARVAELERRAAETSKGDS